MALSVDQALRKAKKHAENSEAALAERLYKDVLERFPNNKRAIEGLRLLNAPGPTRPGSHLEPPQDQINVLTALYHQGRLDAVVRTATRMTAKFPNAILLYNILGAAHAGMRNFDAAVASYRKALQLKPDYIEAHNNLGAVLHDHGRSEEAIASYGKALQIKPDYAEAHNNLGNALRDQNRLTEAVASFGEALRIKPDYAEAHNNLGIVLHELGRSDEAIASYGRALQIKSDYAEAHSNLGIALKDQGRSEEAIASHRKAIEIKPDYAQAHNSLGIALKEQGRFAEAVASYGRALRIKPDYAEAHANLGLALKELGRLEAAIASYGKALEIKPDYAEAHNNLGIALKDQGRMDEAVASYREALRIKPDYVEAHSNLCELYEKNNNLVELEKALEQATLDCGEDNSDILVRHAQLASRKEQFEDVVACLEKVQIEEIPASLKRAYFGLLGKAYDRLDQFEKAFSAFENQNALTRDSVRAEQFDADGYLDSTLERKEAWSGDVQPNWSQRAHGLTQSSPAFLVGFPRSGTTLLDTILRSHSKIGVVEEKPMVDVMSKAFGQPHTIQAFNTLSEAEIVGLRNAYFEELKTHLDPADDGKMIIDKLPLNIRHAGIIHRVFPDAKFILALRHPCDCVLSCFMQSFKLNDAMANFLSLESSARLYAAVMELWTVYTTKLRLNVHVVKYEDLVQDLEATCRPLISYLSLDWEDNLHNYQRTALDRGRIRTPSYSQVVQPLYQQASGRWTKYRVQMQPVLPILRPWIETFEY